MLSEPLFVALGVQRMIEGPLRAAQHPERSPLRASVHHVPGLGGAHVAPRAHPSSVEGADFREVEPGYRWGPVWSTAWFRLVGRVPNDWRGRTVALRFSSGTEATLWREGVPFHGFDPYRDLAILVFEAAGGEEINLLVQADCNLPLGATTFWWDQPEMRARWAEPQPGRLECAELLVLEPAAWRLAEAMDTARKAFLLERPASSDVSQAIRIAMNSGMARLGSAAAAVPRAGTCTAVGHAHIDTAWLWTIACTRRKCLRTFANVLRLMERFKDFHFVCSQAQQYAFVEADSPELLAQIKERVSEGRWEPGGGMWIEPDCTAPSGESFIRQVLHGERYWRAKFGERGRQRFLYLPDTFGFPASLPQIARLCGLDTFITNKISWNETNRFPFVSFKWKGIDGTEIVSHFTPGHNYNSGIEPADLRLGEENLRKQEVSPTSDWLQPFGYGDGGGGPTAEQCVRAELYADFFDLPRVVQSSVSGFCDRLHEGGHSLPIWDGELYLELHRGTYTSQAWMKRANAEAEARLRRIELLACLAGCEVGVDWRASIDAAWKCVLLHQFHDILPGSSIKEVYEDARNEFGALHTQLDQIEFRCAAQVVAAATGADRGAEDRAAAEPRVALVLNEASVTRSGVACTDAGLVFVRDVPAMGVASADPGRGPSAVTAVESECGVTVGNGILTAQVDRAGRITHLARIGGESLAVPASEGIGGALNQLVLYDDRPRSWEAWDIDRDYINHAQPVDCASDLTIESGTELLASVRITRKLGRDSSLTQWFDLEAGSPWLRIRTEVNWQEERKLLRALFPTKLRAPRATFGIQFGAFERSTTDNTSWERMQFEVPGHGWMDLSQPGLGLAVLDDGTKFGRSAKHGTMGLSLLRAPNFPDPTADRGTHRFCYGLIPHGGDWRAAGVSEEAECFRYPLRQLGTVAQDKRSALFALRGLAVHVSALKPSEDGAGMIVRLVERCGSGGPLVIEWSRPTTSVVAVDALEREFVATRGATSGRTAMASDMVGTVDASLAPALQHDSAARKTTLMLRPFQIVTLKVIS